jgi:hypothetical protein
MALPRSVQALTPEERQLYIVLVAGLARHCLNGAAPYGGPGYPFPDYCDHGWQSALQGACVVLGRLEVAVFAVPGLDDDSNLSFSAAMSRYGHFIPRSFKPFPPAEIVARLTSRLPDDSPSFDEVLETYLDVLCGFRVGSPGDYVVLSISREPFTPHTQLSAEVEALERCGYLARIDTRVQWTSKMEPVMQAFGFWKPNGAYAFSPDWWQ